MMVQKVPSNPLWVEFRKGLEQLIEQTPHVTIINATEGGAKIKGTISDTLTNVIEKNIAKTSLSYTLDMLLNESKENLDVSHRKKIKSKSLRIELIKYIDIYFALNQSTSERMVIVERLLDGSETKDKYGIGEKNYIRNSNKNNKHIMKFCHSHVHTQFFSSKSYCSDIIR
ncbi:hypothetical protein GCM10020331_084740 [Ectobacillus funiculus]